MSPADIVILILLGAVLFAAVFFTVHKRRKGGCSCGCEDCLKREDCKKQTK